MTRLGELLDARQRALCERLTRRWEQPARGQRFTDVLGFLLAPALLLWARADPSRPAWDALLLAFLGGGIFGMLPTRLLANRRESLLARLYGELSRREREEGGSPRHA